MQEEEFAALAEQYGQVARRDPRGYRRRVAAFAALGYGYIAGALVVLVGLNVVLAVLLQQLHALGLGAKLILVQLAVAWAVLRSLWVRTTPPAGIRVTRAQAPALFDAIDQVRARIHARRVHHVLLTADLNAALGQYPRLGVFGWWRNYLLLGLPLLRALPADEARAVIAHELAHLSREHGRSGLWSWRVLLTWSRLHDAFAAGDNHGAWLFRRFTRWYLPRFEAATAALMRAHEYEADELSARVAGVPAAARAQTRLEALDRFHADVLWPRFVDQADHHPRPPCGWVSAFCRGLAAPEPPADADEWLARRMSERGNPSSTHPPLGDRLRALGVDAPPPEALRPVERDAATELLGPLAATLEAEFDRRWLARSAQEWSERYEESQAEMRRLAELDEGAVQGTLAPAQALERAYLVSAWRNAEEARQLFTGLADQLPAARAALGQLLLESGDGAGIAHLEQAAADDPGLAVAAAAHIAAFHEREGRAAEAAGYRRRARAEAREDAAADRERQTLDGSAQVQPHTLDAEQLQTVLRTLAGEPRVRRAWLVRRVIRHRPEYPVHLLVLRDARWRAFGKRRRELAGRIAAALHIRGLYVAFHDHEGIGKKARRVAGSLVFDRDARPAGPR